MPVCDCRNPPETNAPTCPLLNIPSSSTFLHLRKEGTKNLLQNKYPNEKSVSIPDRRFVALSAKEVGDGLELPQPWGPTHPPAHSLFLPTSPPLPSAFACFLCRMSNMMPTQYWSAR